MKGVIQSTQKSNIVIGNHKSNITSTSVDIFYKLVLSQIHICEYPDDMLSLLPPYLLHAILLFLEDIKGIVACRLINKVFFKACDEAFWQKMCLQRFFLSTKTKETWFETYTAVRPAISEGKDFVNKYELLNVIGGKWVKMLQVRNKETRYVHGLQVIKVEGGKLNKYSATFYKYLNGFINPFMVRIYEFGFSDETGKLYVITDYIDRDLGGYVFSEDKKPYFTKKTVQFLIAQVILVAEFMHSKGVLFKCSNFDKIRITENGYVKFNWISKEIVGTPLSHRISIIDAFEYSAPEFVEGGEFRLSCVFWGLGCLIYQLIGGEPLLQNTATNLIALAREIFTLDLTFSPLFDTDTKDLLLKLLEKEPTKRLTRFELLKSHPFFDSIDWHALFNLQIAAPDELISHKIRGEEDDTTINAEFCI